MFTIIMGVSGCGKTTIASKLAIRLNSFFYDADDFHPPENIAKMASGLPLNDDDRAGWLDSLATLIRQQTEKNMDGVLACSALKQSYREVLKSGGPVQFVYLKGSYDLIMARLSARSGHYMRPTMLQSQFNDLEEPYDALTVEIDRPVEEVISTILEECMLKEHSIAIIGLGVMGRSLAINLKRNGFNPIGYDPNATLPDGFSIPVARSLEQLTLSLAHPRVFLLMVPAGKAVDEVIVQLQPLLLPQDILIDGGNTFYADTERRQQELARTGLTLVGMGVSGGETGALLGPSLMPGGDMKAWKTLKPILTKISARTDDDQACVAWMGSGGAGHFVKMVHNGIEYGDMQLIAEIYDLLHRGAGISNAELSEHFAKWNKGPLRSYLIEITATILARLDGRTTTSLVDLIVDEAAQKGTGKWTSQTSFDLGAPIPTINAAVEARMLSSFKNQRVIASELFGGSQAYTGDKDQLLSAAEHALYASKITSYVQGFAMLKIAAEEHGWKLNLAAIANVWRAGCIIRSDLLPRISAAYQDNPHLTNLFFHPLFATEVKIRQHAWRQTLTVGIQLGIPMPAMAASLSYFDGYRSSVLPANLTQAQRDYFGAHTYHRVDKPGIFHTQWEDRS